MIGSYRHNPRALWKTINHVMGRSAHHLPPALPLRDLASHFSSLLYQPGTEYNLPLGPMPQNGFSQFQPVTSKEVLELLKNLKPSKSPGPDQIRPSELKMVAKEIAWSVSILFNETLATGELPQEFKMGNIVPLLKPGKTNTALPSNYRGIVYFQSTGANRL